MGKHAAVLTAVCFLLCLGFNFTFPLHKAFKEESFSDNHSQSSSVHDKSERHEGIVERTKQMSANLERALQKFMASSPIKENIKNVSKCSHAKPAIYDSDLSNYEQLVIMKKYPFLDLQQLHSNYRPLSNKNARQSLNSAHNIAQDSSFCESLDEVPNVEITNRGLSGFAIPMKLVKTGDSPEIKTNIKNSQNVINGQLEESPPLTTDPIDELRLLKSLEEDIKKNQKFANMG